MSTDESELEALNTAIGEAESAGNVAWLAGVLAPELAFSRANGTIDDAGRFLMKVEKGARRVTHYGADAIRVLGNRAIVECVVAMELPGGGTRHFHNLRVFIRTEGKWRLLAWANEEIDHAARVLLGIPSVAGGS